MCPSFAVLVEWILSEVSRELMTRPVPFLSSPLSLPLYFSLPPTHSRKPQSSKTKKQKIPHLTPPTLSSQQAQSNLTALNAIVWGTCNTDSSKDTCVSNMDWFRDQMQVACDEELKEDNAMVGLTFRGAWRGFVFLGSFR